MLEVWWEGGGGGGHTQGRIHFLMRVLHRTLTTAPCSEQPPLVYPAFNGVVAFTMATVRAYTPLRCAL
jgi:hypothetical protein